jgi:asparagine synthase (glutamine-hydrolysing)
VPEQQGFMLTESPYWVIGQNPVRLDSDEAYIRKMEELVTDSVNRRLDAIPGLIGAELSGGLDSSVIDILINRHGRKACYFSWSISPEELPIREAGDERQVISDICAQEGISCHFLSKREQTDYADMLRDGAPPFVDTPQLGYGSAWMNRQGARVVFTGHAGDEGVSHRGNRYELFYNREYSAYFSLYREDLQGKPFRFLRSIRSGLVNARKNRRKLLEQIPESAYDAPALTKEFCSRMRSEFEDQQMYFFLDPKRYVRQGGTRPRLDNAAYQGANAGMRYLFPYVDYRVIDYAVSIPRRLYVSHNNSRVIFREAFRKIMPKSLYDVNYKDLASIRDLPRQPQQNQRLRNSILYLAENLDRAFWGGILDLDAIAAMEPSGEHRSKEASAFKLLLHTLNRALFIQNMVKVAREWEEHDHE